MSNELYYRDDNGDILTETEVNERFDDMLDEVYGDFEVAGITICASRVLEECDPIAYRVYRSDFLSEFEELTEDELDSED